MPDRRSGHERINGADLYYEMSGSGPAVVLLHGGLCHLRQWDDLAARLGPGHQVIRYDRRGHGQSSFPDLPYSHAADLAGLLDALDVRSADLVAVSAGVGVAVELAIATPRVVRRLVLGAGTMGGYRHTAEFSAGIGAILQAGARGDKGRAADLLATFAPLRVAVTLPEVWPRVRAMMIDDYSFAHSREGAPKPDLMSPPSGCRFHPRCPWCFEVCPERMPPEIPIGDGGHSRCWLNDPYVANKQRAEAFFRGVPVEAGVE